MSVVWIKEDQLFQQIQWQFIFEGGHDLFQIDSDNPLALLKNYSELYIHGTIWLKMIAIYNVTECDHYNSLKTLTEKEMRQK